MIKQWIFYHQSQSFIHFVSTKKPKKKKPSFCRQFQIKIPKNSSQINLNRIGEDEINMWMRIINKKADNNK